MPSAAGTLGNPGIFKIATITIPKDSNITGTLEFDIQSRHYNFNIMVNISYNTYFSLSVIVNDNSLISNKPPFYYYVDKTNDIDNVILYYETIQYDTINVKVTSKTGILDLSYTIDNIKVDALPEGAIQVHNVNYGNKNLFYATPKDAAGDPKFRAIDITDIPDLSSKYGTKAEITTINSSIVDVRTSLESTQTDFVDLRNKVNAMPKTVFITQAAYNALTTKDANTIYYING